MISGDQGKSPSEDEIPIEWLQSSPTPASAPIDSIESPRLLTVCMAQEPVSLFIYGDSSISARSIRQAIYDGPIDSIDYSFSPVILSTLPTLANGDATFEPVSVASGGLITDKSGNLNNLTQGVSYFPSGCQDSTCVQTYTGEASVQIDQLVVQFRLLPGLSWSDNEPLTADDSVFSFEIAKSLYPNVRPELVAHTQEYQLVDDNTVQWRGIPGYRQEDFGSYFFTPLPRHSWESLSPEELFTAEVSSRTPIGWGPYVIDEWTQGDHISLSRNPNYFRTNEGLPAFNKLVFRFIPDREGALAALMAGECDYLDETFNLEAEGVRLMDMNDAGQLALAVEIGSSWEQLAFGLAPLDSGQQNFFQDISVRQAVAHCIDRQRLVDELWMGLTLVPDAYIHPEHPLANSQVKRYPYDPDTAASILKDLGWLDEDEDPETPRLAQGVLGLEDGTPFVVPLLTTNEPQKLQAARILEESLARCGISLEIVSMPWQELFAPGPDGVIFGRKFSLAQFGWISPVFPPCSLYTTREIPGPYPDYPKGWGGSNPSAYSNPNYDQTCRDAIATLPEMLEHQSLHYQAQMIYSEELPSLPLYLPLKMIATRTDLCGVIVDPSAESALWNLENFNYGASCNN